MRREQPENEIFDAGPHFEMLNSEQLAARWQVPVSWIREHTRRRAIDPIPCVRFGKYVRFAWGSPELTAWVSRRKSGRNNRLI